MTPFSMMDSGLPYSPRLRCTYGVISIPHCRRKEGSIATCMGLAGLPRAAREEQGFSLYLLPRDSCWFGSHPGVPQGAIPP